MRAARGMRLIGAFMSLSALFACASTSSLTMSAALNVSFDEQPVNAVITSPRVTGSASGAIVSSTLTLNGGRATSHAGVPGSGQSMRLPTYARLSYTTPLAVVSIRNKAGTTDPLDPGSKRFIFRADFSLDDTSGNAPTNSDGDNLFQRGLSPHTQWRLSVDGHQARCSVKTAGSSARVQTPAITIPRKTTNSSWYRAVCLRDTDSAATLSLTVYRYDVAARAWKLVQSTRVRGAGGSLTMNRAIPISIGGKLNNSNTIQRGAPDQFNGLVDNVSLIIG